MPDLANGGRPSAVTRIYFWIVVAAAVAVFLITRGTDYAAFPKMVVDLAIGPLSGLSEFWSAALKVAFGLCIFGSSVAVGHLIDRAISPPSASGHSHVLEFGRKATIGASIWLIVTMVVSRLDLGSIVVAAVAAIATLPLLIIFARRAREVGDESRVPERATNGDRILATAILALAGAAFLAAVATGTFTAAAMFWALPVLAMSVFGWARESLISRRESLFAGVLAALVPALFYATHVEFRDVLIGLIGVFAAVSLLRTATLRSMRWAVMLSIFVVAFVAIHFG